MSDAQAKELTKITTTLGTGKVTLEGLNGEEGLSQLFRFELDLSCADAKTDVGSLVATEATVTIQDGTDSGMRRYIHGVITSVALKAIDPVTSTVFYQAVLEPKLCMLRFSADNRIFQNKNVPDIVTQILSDAAITAVTNSTTATYAVREYCVQYGETHLNFVMRLLESEGIYFFFKHTSSAHTLVLADDLDGHPDVPNTPTLTFRAHTSRYVDEDDIVSDVSYEQRITSGAYGVDNYAFETPATPLYSKSTGTRTTLEVNEFPGWHATTTTGEAIAKRRLEALEVEAALLGGSGKLRNLVAGYKFTLAGHVKTALNVAYIVRTLRIEAPRGRYEVTFKAFPATAPFRPPATAMRSTVFSTQTAKVVGKSGEEQWMDKYGRVKVQFHWDRLGKNDENSSCWVRVAQGLAGSSWGMVFLPRIGQEVVVSFLDGDPDHPLITGAVYNATLMPPYTLPTNQTKSTIKTQSSKNGTGKSNEIRFEDKLDSEEWYAHAQKDMLVEVENDETRTVKHDQKVTITNDATLTINHDNTITVKNDRNRTVSEGNESLTVSKGTRKVSVEGNETHDNAADFTQTVKGNHKLSVTGNLTIEVTGALSIKAASIKMESTSGAVELKSAMAFKAESGMGFDIKSGLAMAINSGLNLDLKATAALSAQGLTTALKGDTMVEVNAGAMLKLAGALVKIN